MFLFLGFCFSQVYLTTSEERSFLNWMRVNNRYYTSDEYHLRLGIYLANKRFVEDFNKNDKVLHKVALNKFACSTPAEYQTLLGVIPQLAERTTQQTHRPVVSTANDPESFDWREKGAVNPPKNQGGCGSCWAFSAIAGEEGTYFVTSGKLLVLSEQNIVDCTFTCYGCFGGLPELGLGQALNNQQRKFQLDSDYPYTAVQEACRFDLQRGVADISAITMYRQEKDLQPNLLKWGPTSVCIDASGNSFMLYSGGVYEGTDCGTIQNHAVCAVGYGTDNGTPYWIVRNSWGPDWGEQGYIRMLKNVNVCNIQGTITGIEI